MTTNHKSRTCSIAEAALILGCGQHAVRRMVKRGDLRALLIGRKLRVVLTSIDALLEAGTASRPSK